MKKEQDIKIGQRIKHIRSELGLNQKEFANKIDATVSALSNWENGRNKPNDIMLNNISKLGDITVDELLHGIGYTPERIYNLLINSPNRLLDILIPFFNEIDDYIEKYKDSLHHTSSIPELDYFHTITQEYLAIHSYMDEKDFYRAMLKSYLKLLDGWTFPIQIGWSTPEEEQKLKNLSLFLNNPDNNFKYILPNLLLSIEEITKEDQRLVEKVLIHKVDKLQNDIEHYFGYSWGDPEDGIHIPELPSFLDKETYKLFIRLIEELKDVIHFNLT